MSLSDQAVAVRFPNIEKIDLAECQEIEASPEWYEQKQYFLEYEKMLREEPSNPVSVAKYHSLRQKFDCNIPSFVNENSSSFDIALEVAFLMWSENRGRNDALVRERMPFLFWHRNVDVEKIVYSPEVWNKWLTDTEGSPHPGESFTKVRVLVPLTFIATIRRELPSLYQAAELLIQEGVFDYQDLKDRIARKGIANVV